MYNMQVDKNLLNICYNFNIKFVSNANQAKAVYTKLILVVNKYQLTLQKKQKYFFNLKT